MLAEVLDVADFFFLNKTMGEVEDLTLAAQRKEGIREKNVQIHILN